MEKKQRPLTRSILKTKKNQAFARGLKTGSDEDARSAAKQSRQQRERVTPPPSTVTAFPTRSAPSTNQTVNSILPDTTTKPEPTIKLEKLESIMADLTDISSTPKSVSLETTGVFQTTDTYPKSGAPSATDSASTATKPNPTIKLATDTYPNSGAPSVTDSASTATKPDPTIKFENIMANLTGISSTSKPVFSEATGVFLPTDSPPTSGAPSVPDSASAEPITTFETGTATWQLPLGIENNLMTLSIDDRFTKISFELQKIRLEHSDNKCKLYEDVLAVNDRVLDLSREVKKELRKLGKEVGALKTKLLSELDEHIEYSVSHTLEAQFTELFDKNMTEILDKRIQSTVDAVSAQALKTQTRLPFSSSNYKSPFSF